MLFLINNTDKEMRIRVPKENKKGKFNKGKKESSSFSIETVLRKDDYKEIKRFIRFSGFPIPSSLSINKLPDKSSDVCNLATVKEPSRLNYEKKNLDPLIYSPINKDNRPKPSHHNFIMLIQVPEGTLDNHTLVLDTKCNDMKDKLVPRVVDYYFYKKESLIYLILNVPITIYNYSLDLIIKNTDDVTQSFGYTFYYDNKSPKVITSTYKKNMLVGDDTIEVYKYKPTIPTYFLLVKESEYNDLISFMKSGHFGYNSNGKHKIFKIVDKRLLDDKGNKIEFDKFKAKIDEYKIKALTFFTEDMTNDGKLVESLRDTLSTLFKIEKSNDNEFTISDITNYSKGK